MVSAFQSQPEKYWDRLFAPSSCLAVITTISGSGSVNAASFGTVLVFITIRSTSPSRRPGNDTATNVLETGEFVANLPSFEKEVLEK
jgi:flavin reductase (DIM6/NTAB) family NADH-FMN oxidoreductase RutF